MYKMVKSAGILAVVLVGLVGAQDYCSITKQHTMCKYQGIGKSCNGEALKRGVNTIEKFKILKVHNKLRAKIANGEEKRGKPGPQPPASNMRKMEWDEELAKVAQRHADQCRFAHDCSDCRRVDRFGVGQNLYIYKQSLRLPKTNWDKAVTDWYDEVVDFSNKWVEPFQFRSETGHYSQNVWADTNKVGCGATSYKDGKWFTTLYTCNYGPNGNFIRGAMYKQGEACSECPTGHKCSKQYPGLCEEDLSSGSESAPTFTPSKPDASKPVSSNTGNNRPSKPFQSTADRFTPVNTRPTTTATTTTTTTTTTTRRTTRRPTTRRTTTRRTTTRRPTTARTTTTRRTTTRRTTTTTTRPTTTQRTTTRRPTTTTTRRPTTTARTTTTSGPESPVDPSSNGTLLYCSFESRSNPCKVRSAGAKWSTEKNSFNGVPNLYYGTTVKSSEKTEMFFENLISPPSGGVACVDFKYKKFSTGDSVPMTVMAWPFRGKPGKVSIVRDSPDFNTWVRAQVTYRNIENYFLVMIKSSGPKEKRADLYLAIDDVHITEGKCDN